MSTIKDVAEYAGLSIATISKYLNGGTVRRDNRAAIEEAIQKLNYQVNPFARSLKTSRSMTIGVLLPTIGHPFFGTIVSELESRMRQYGYDCLISSYEFSPELEARKLSFFLNSRVDGLVYVPETMEAAALREALKSNPVPIVFLDRIVPGFSADGIIVDNLNAVYLAVERLIGRGHRRIGVILGPENVFTAQERLTGYRRVMADYSLEVDEALIRFGAYYDTVSGYRCFEELMQLEQPPSAVCVTNYDLTFGAVTAAHDRGIALPAALDFIGYDCADICSIMAPPLPVVVQPIKEMGRLAAEYMWERLSGSDVPPHLSRLKSSITEP